MHRYPFQFGKIVSFMWQILPKYFEKNQHSSLKQVFKQNKSKLETVTESQ